LSSEVSISTPLPKKDLLNGQAFVVKIKPGEVFKCAGTYAARSLIPCRGQA